METIVPSPCPGLDVLMVAAVRPDEDRGDPEAQAGARYGCLMPLASKRLATKLFVFVRRDADALVGDGQVNACRFGTRLDRYGRAGRGIFGGILKKLSERLLDQARNPP